MGRFAYLAGLLLGMVLVSSAAHAQTQLRVATWNVTNYSSGRVAEFQTAIYGEFEGRSMSPDIIVGQEFLSVTGVINFLSILNTAPGSPGDWAGAAFVDGPDTDSAFFYRTSVVQLARELSPNGVTVVATGGVSPNHPRNIMRYDVQVAAGTSAETRMAIYSSHMKSGSSSDDLARRLLEAQRIRDDAEALPEGWHFLLGGDFNIPTWTQAAYQELVGSQVNNDGRFFDPISTPGSWQNNPSFVIVHTQDPALQMDDRYDQILVSAGLVDGLNLDYIGEPSIPYSTITWDDPLHSYRSWGNDGTSYDTVLTTAGNEMVGETIAQALVDSASGQGHLPVFLDLRVPPCLGDVECDGDTDQDDFVEFANCLNSPPAAPSQFCLDYFDFDENGDVDCADWDTFRTFWTGPPEEPPAMPQCDCVCGDLDGDGGNVDLADFSSFALCFGMPAPSAECPADLFTCADLDQNGGIDLADFGTFALGFGLSSTNAPPNCP
ncbi:MAG: hypothetical protein JSU68_02725 [Phycisphaerales bacterium]|nr:MAG: hypothetical protein JSU68_02725 [Phycisphaerales bacterium]